MIAVDNKSCTGCSACAAVCAQGAISMKPDEFGFLRPVVDMMRCTECGLCERICPLSREWHVEVLPECYAAKTRDDDLLMKSTSGGVFSELAKRILEEHGVVYGCVLQNLNPVHVRAETLGEIAPMRGSKYVQSDVGNTFCQCRNDLASGRQVLYSGTPCQIAGLRAYLGKEYANLLTVALICHGVASPKIFRDYLKCEESLYGARVGNVRFRDKMAVDGESSFVISWINPEMAPLIEGSYASAYERAFLSAYSSRESCFACHFRSGKSNADIVIGDFWGIQNVLPDFPAAHGASAVLAYTLKGQDAIRALNLYRVEVKYDDISRFNYNLDHDSVRPRDRNRFMSRMLRGESLRGYFFRLDNPGFMIRVLRFARRCMGKIVRILGACR